MHRIFLPSLLILALVGNVFSQCNQNYEWAVWNNFTGTSATATINSGTSVYNMTMTANYSFGSTPVIFNYAAFSGFSGVIPNTTVPQTDWSAAPGVTGVTTMCFTEPVANPVLLIASLGRPNLVVTLEFSKPYNTVFDGGGMTYPNNTTIMGQEGFAIIVFPGDFDCVTIYSTTPEYYTNITWGVNPPLFEVEIEGELIACDSVTLTASGGSFYSWSGGSSPNSATNTFYSSGDYFITVTDDDGCEVVTSRSIDIQYGSFSHIEAEICEGEFFEGYAESGTYQDVFTGSNGCDSTRTLNLTVYPHIFTTLDMVICQGQSFEGYNESGSYTDVFGAANGCDSVRTLNLEVIPAFSSTQSITLCNGAEYDFYGQILSEEGIYTASFTSLNGCDSTISLEVKIARDFFLGNDTTICLGNEFLLTSPSNETRWFDQTISQTKVVNETGLYWASYLDSQTGCLLTDSVFVRFDFRVYVPNLFSPNADGINDRFLPHFSDQDFSFFQFSVYDRWGGLVYSTSNPDDKGWDGTFEGKPCSQGAYLYLITAEASCGKTLLKGDITLMR